MLAILENLRSGEIHTCEVPPPELRPGGILVKTAFSAISAGTERAHREQAEKSLIGKAMARPELVRQVIDHAKKQGIRSVYERVQTRLNTLSPLGYSCAGTVLAVGEGVSEFQTGDRVACAGVGYANHCEINFVPRNLAVRVPEKVSLENACLTTIGAIAVQGLRQSGANFGETVAVIGAGLVGVLTIQLAKAAGCRVIAIDLDAERAQRSLSMGADLGLCSASNHIPEAIAEYSRHGADVAIITAATPSNAPIELAAMILRDRGRIVIVGDVGLSVSRHNVYHKELSITLSRSYGPGRYDPQYEQKGVDYPIGYVRWTEKRNMEAFLTLLAAGALKLAPLVQCCYSVQEGNRAYDEIKSGAYTVLIKYPPTFPEPTLSKALVAPVAKKLGPKEMVNIGCIGAGSFAQSVIFPVVRGTKGAVLRSVATASGVATETARRTFGFIKAQSSSDLIQDPENDAVFVLSRHDSHAHYVVRALSQHKPVFVEKPLAIAEEQLEEIRSAAQTEREQGYAPFVMVGFNRRFASLTRELRRFFAGRKEPMMVHVRINAGYLPLDHWTQRKEDGGRILGELCHFIDWSRSVTDSPIQQVSAYALPDGSRYNRDNVLVTLVFQDSSLANLLYVANGDKSVSKEYMEVFCQGRVARLHDFRSLELSRDGKTRSLKSSGDKGHQREIELTLAAIRQETESPIAFEEVIEISQATLAVVRSIESGQPVKLHKQEEARLRQA
ncbi:MAG TPA: bi-domain-containing oxidoreductase [Terriglobales bacterium]|nr:bi-domain-containing oxidoreductase [Terriglobales bacterium]